jgi:hypothetical protein
MPEWKKITKSIFLQPRLHSAKERRLRLKSQRHKMDGLMLETMESGIRFFFLRIWILKADHTNTPLCHTTTSHHCITPHQYTTISHYYITPLHHTPTSHHYVIPLRHTLRHTTTSHHYVTPLCHTTMSNHYVTPLRHTTMSHHYVTPLRHTTTSHHLVTPCHTKIHDTVLINHTITYNITKQHHTNTPLC